MTDNGHLSSWGRLPVASSVAGVGPRQKLVTQGMVVDVVRRRWAGLDAWAVRLDDGTGSVGLVFTGRGSVPGLVLGARCRVEGTTTVDPQGPLLVMWNPAYELLSAPGASLSVVMGG